MHEAWHDRLQFTTLYGLLVQHLWAIGDATGAPDWTNRGNDLLRGAQRTHEEFASVMTEMTSGDLAEAVRADYPRYAQFADRARGRAGETDAYTLLHRINAVYRSCMQPADLVDIATDLRAVTAASVTRRSRPDHRLEVLTRALAHQGWPDDDAATAETNRTIGDYADEDNNAWERASHATYTHAAALLTDAGCPTLPYEGQLAHVDGLNERAIAAAGRPIRLIAMTASTKGPETDVDVVLRAFESETLSWSPQPPWAAAPPGTLDDMESGRGADGHLFVAIRPSSRVDLAHPGLLPQHRPDHVALLRSVHRDADGSRTVVLRDITADGPDALLAQDTTVIVSISMRSLSQPEVVRRWASVLDPATSTVLMDLSPTRHLRSWLADPDAAARYGLGAYTVVDREAVALGIQVRTPLGASRLFLAVVSRSFAAAFEVWLAGSPDVRDRIVRDDTLLDKHESVVSTTVGHLIAEEAFFNFQAGGTP